ncbi:COX15/CtaA family protein [Nocardioides bruguierae]|uniref:COX15/CtaA family protein n=1 Tax=Nocardioides bruguierae TaxID=2945102 RepID=A0A9X2ICN8_9ACTN|nr:COX15/CtaA family protein [Nocardioides bruguierae]MCM0618906.1 COX15/CtaA family protein [Nocardioides bruguierae]
MSNPDVVPAGRLRTMRRAAWASIVANAVIVVTGGAVRLTASGLGCPTWPKCTSTSFTPEAHLHGIIEFGNRLLTYVLVAIAIWAFVAAWRTARRDLRKIAFLAALGIPVQAVLGGITVLTGLTWWVVGAHMILSMILIGLSVLLLHRTYSTSAPRRGPAVVLAWIVLAAAALVIVLGVVVTGAGPHAGDADVPRSGLDTLQVSQLHADAVFLYIGLTVGLLLLLLATGAPRASVRAAWWLIGVQLAQAVIGFVQYFTGVPEVLVGAHMAGTTMVAGWTTWLLLQVRQPPREPRGDEPVQDLAATTSA